MRHQRSICATAMLAVMAPGLAAADVTAADIWADMQAYAASTGQDLSAEGESPLPNGLRLTGVTSTMMDFGKSVWTFPEILMEEAGGAVTITLAPVLSFTSEMELDDESSSTMNGTLGHEGLSIEATGEPGDILYTLTADRLEMAATQNVDGAGAMVMSFATGLDGMAGTARSRMGGETVAVVYDFTAEAADLELTSTAEEEEPGSFAMQSRVADLAVTGEAQMPAQAAGVEFAELLTNGMQARGGYTMGAGKAAFSFAGPDGAMQAESDFAGAEVSIAMAPEGISYDGAARGIALTVGGEAIPLPPVEIGIENYGFGVTMPFAASETPQDFGLLVRMAGVTVDEALWRLFDPLANIPRDPATLLVDVSGKGNWLFDIFDPEAAAAVEAAGDVPGEIHALDINALRLAVGGAELEGEGAFTFDNADTETWDGLPAPDGALDLVLTGGNALLEKLEALGLVSPEQALSTRMMLAVFTRPVEGQDKMTSRIEVQPDGAVLANGTRLK